MLTYILLGAFSIFVCVFSRFFGHKFGLLDFPDGDRKTHDSAVPLLGGIAVTVPVIIMCGLCVLGMRYMPLYAVLGVVVSMFLLVGMIDDSIQIRPLYRLFISTIIFLSAVLVVPALGVDFLLFSFYPNLITPDTWFLLIFTMFCLVGVQNATNMADGKNGLVIGLSLIWTALLFVYGPFHLQPLLIVLSVGLVLTLIFNLTGRLFLGDSGSYSISACIGLLTVYSYGIGFSDMRADIVALWFLIPIVDCLRLMGERLYKGRSPFRSDQNHLHHILTHWMPWRWGLLVYLSLVGVPCGLSILMPEWVVAWAVAVLAVYVSIVLLGKRRFVREIGKV